MTEQQDNLTTNTSRQDVGWEREVIEKIALAAITEQRRARRWNIFFKALMFTYLFVIFAVAMAPRFEASMSDSDKHTAVINIAGIILEDSEANAKSIIKGMRNAVKDEGTQGIILHLNTPGGSPVQSAYIYEEILQIKKENPDLPIYAVVSDICASGGYYIASAADKIYVNQASIIGSIGVIMDGYGFVEILKKLGIERRLMTAGKNKALLDPFSPVNEQEKQHIQVLLAQVHKQFIDAVKHGRGDRLKDNGNLFSGLIWTGAESIKLGLVDAIGNDDYVAKEIIGAEKLVNFTPREHIFDRLVGRMGASFGQKITSFFQMQLR